MDSGRRLEIQVDPDDADMLRAAGMLVLDEEIAPRPVDARTA